MSLSIGYGIVLTGVLWLVMSAVNNDIQTSIDNGCQAGILSKAAYLGLIGSKNLQLPISGMFYPALALLAFAGALMVAMAFTEFKGTVIADASAMDVHRSLAAMNNDQRRQAILVIAAFVVAWFVTALGDAHYKYGIERSYSEMCFGLADNQTISSVISYFAYENGTRIRQINVSGFYVRYANGTAFLEKEV